MRFGIKVVALLSLLCAIEAAPGIINVTAIADSIYSAAADEADISDFSFLVQVRDGSNLCAGSLLHADWVLTAAHCVDGKKAQDIRVIGGSSYLNGYGGTKSSVSLIEVVPDNNTDSTHADLAILKLKNPLSGPNISTIALASSTPQTGSPVIVTGWGNSDSCQGDSGGPLIQNNKLVGIVSLGCAEDLPNFFEDFDKVQKFIKDSILGS